MYKYQADVVRVVDGDTLVVNIDVGFNIRHEITARILGIDTHEIHFVKHESEEYKRGMKEREFVQDWVEEGQISHSDRFPFVVETRVREGEKGKYGRYLIDIVRKSDSSTLTAELKENFKDIDYE